MKNNTHTHKIDIRWSVRSPHMCIWNCSHRINERNRNGQFFFVSFFRFHWYDGSPKMNRSHKSAYLSKVFWMRKKWVSVGFLFKLFVHLRSWKIDRSIIVLLFGIHASLLAFSRNQGYDISWLRFLFRTDLSFVDSFSMFLLVFISFCCCCCFVSFTHCGVCLLISLFFLGMNSCGKYDKNESISSFSSFIIIVICYGCNCWCRSQQKYDYI